MSDNPHFEIPEAVRDIAEQNVEQARTAYAQFMDMTRQAQDMVTRSQGALAANAMNIQALAMQYAQQNIDASFRFASDLARARDLNEYVEIQTKYAQKQMKTYSEQAQQLGQMMANATKSGR